MAARAEGMFLSEYRILTEEKINNSFFFPISNFFKNDDASADVNFKVYMIKDLLP